VTGAVTLLALLTLGTAAPITGSTASARDSGFSDVPDSHLFHDNISWMAAADIAGGYPDGTYRPTAPVSHQAMAAFLHRFDGGGSSTLTEPFFADVPPTHPFYDDIQWMAEEGISLGTPQAVGKPLYEPTLALSRQTVAAYLHAYQVDPVVTLVDPFFGDVGNTHALFTAIQWMAESGIAAGVPDAGGPPLFEPTRPVSRQALAAFLHRYHSLLDPTLRCNGARELCDRAYNDVSYATTHNAMSSQEDGFAGPNQTYGLPRQFEDGIRAVMLDTHYNSTVTAPQLAAPDAPDGVPLLCHAYCRFGWRLLSDGLTDIKTFLDENPGEIITIIFESYVTRQDTLAAFTEVGLLDMALEHTAGTPWPTLREMIDSGKRLVVLTDSGGGVYPWYLNVWAEAFETHFSAKVPDDLTCDPNRGNPGNSLFILNHFLTEIIGKVTLAEQVNHNPFFVDRALECEAANSHIPNFPTVDFYDIGDVVEVVDTLNGL
jgi:hypothetical protein